MEWNDRQAGAMTLRRGVRLFTGHRSSIFPPTYCLPHHHRRRRSRGGGTESHTDLITSRRTLQIAYILVLVHDCNANDSELDNVFPVTGFKTSSADADKPARRDVNRISAYRTVFEINGNFSRKCIEHLRPN